jgi:hypothetical protein
MYLPELWRGRKTPDHRVEGLMSDQRQIASIGVTPLAVEMVTDVSSKRRLEVRIEERGRVPVLVLPGTTDA